MNFSFLVIVIHVSLGTQLSPDNPPPAPFAPLSLSASMERMASAVQSVMPPVDNSQVEQAIGNAGLLAASEQIAAAKGDSLLERIVRSLVEARLDAHFYTGMCARNYSVPCPNGYTQDPSGTKCLVGDVTDENMPPECAVYNIDLLGASDFARRCKTQWPCASCTKSFKTCPEKFEQVNDVEGVCAPKREYTGPCREVVDFRKFKSRETKARWATSCYTDWPCDPE